MAEHHTDDESHVGIMEEGAIFVETRAVVAGKEMNAIGDFDADAIRRHEESFVCPLMISTSARDKKKRSCAAMRARLLSKSCRSGS